MMDSSGALRAAAESFQQSGQQLFAALSAVNERVERVEIGTRMAGEDQEAAQVRVCRELQALRTFTQSVHTRLQAHDDFVRNPRFLQGVEEHAYQVVMTKCLPEVWKLHANVDSLRKSLQDLAANRASASTANVPMNASTSDIANDVESCLVRLAAFGEERILHVEIIGDCGRSRQKSGVTPRRTIVTEEELSKQGSALPVPHSWKSDSDSRTINKNFEQVTRFLNEIVLVRIDQVEKRLESRIERLDKRVEILTSLFQALNRKTEREDAVVNSEAGSHPKQMALPETSALPGAHSPQLVEENIPEPCPEKKLIENRQSQTVTIQRQTDTCDSADANAASTPATAAAAPEKRIAQSSQTLAGVPKKSHQSGAKAGRAAFNRSVS